MLTLRLEIPVRGGDDPHIERQIPQSPDPSKTPLFQYAQKLRLQVELQLPNLIEEDRSALGLLEEPFFSGLRVREGTFLVAKEFALDQGPRNRCQVDCHKRVVPSIRSIVNGLGDQILAGSALPLQQDRRGLAGSDLPRQRECLPHRA